MLAYLFVYCNPLSYDSVEIVFSTFGSFSIFKGKLGDVEKFAKEVGLDCGVEIWVEFEGFREMFWVIFWVGVCGIWSWCGYDVGRLKYYWVPWDVIFFWVGGGGGRGWYLKELVDGYLGVRIGLGSQAGMFKLILLLLLWFFISRNGEQDGAPWLIISTAANFDGQLTIS